MYLRSRGSRRAAVALAAGAGWGTPAVAAIAGLAAARPPRPDGVGSSPGARIAGSLAASSSSASESAAGTDPAPEPDPALEPALEPAAESAPEPESGSMAERASGSG